MRDQLWMEAAIAHDLRDQSIIKIIFSVRKLIYFIIAL